MLSVGQQMLLQAEPTQYPTRGNDGLSVNRLHGRLRNVVHGVKLGLVLCPGCSLPVCAWVVAGNDRHPREPSHRAVRRPAPSSCKTPDFQDSSVNCVQSMTMRREESPRDGWATGRESAQTVRSWSILAYGTGHWTAPGLCGWLWPDPSVGAAHFFDSPFENGDPYLLSWECSVAISFCPP